MNQLDLQGSTMPIILSFDNDIEGAIRKSCDHDGDRSTMYLVNAAKIVRK